MALSDIEARELRELRQSVDLHMEYVQQAETEIRRLRSRIQYLERTNHEMALASDEMIRVASQLVI